MLLCYRGPSERTNTEMSQGHRKPWSSGRDSMVEPFLQGESANSPQAATAPHLCLRENQEKGAARKPLAKIRGVYKQESGVSLARMFPELQNTPAPWVCAWSGWSGSWGGSSWGDLPLPGLQRLQLEVDSAGAGCRPVLGSHWWRALWHPCLSEYLPHSQQRVGFPKPELLPDRS